MTAKWNANTFIVTGQLLARDNPVEQGGEEPQEPRFPCPPRHRQQGKQT